MGLAKMKFMSRGGITDDRFRMTNVEWRMTKTRPQAGVRNSSFAIRHPSFSSLPRDAVEKRPERPVSARDVVVNPPLSAECAQARDVCL